MFINKHLLQFIKGLERKLGAVIILELCEVALGTIISLAGAFAVRFILGDELIGGFSSVNYYFAAIGICLLLRFFISGKRITEANIFSADIKLGLREKLMDKIYDLGPAYMTTTKTGSITDIISNKVEWLSYYYSLYLPSAFTSLINAVAIMVFLTKLDVFAAIICAVATVCMSICPMCFYGLMEKHGLQEWQAHTDYYSDCLESIQGINTLKAYNANEDRKKYIAKGGERLRRAVMEHLKVSMLENGLLELLGRIGSAVSVAVAVMHSYSIGGRAVDMILVLFLTSACFGPLMNLVNVWHMGYRGVTASYSIAELLNADSAYKEKRTNCIANDIKQTGISFEHVNFMYKKEDGQVLHDINLEIQPGTVTALVGPSGSGKSTIAQLLAGFYPVTDGRITVDGEVVDKKTIEHIRKRMACVWQDSHLFYENVKENISFGTNETGLNDVKAAAALANIDERITTLLSGYETNVGEDGDMLSGGERQRIILARAFFKKPDILILDEATSSLDRQNEIYMQKSISRLMEGRTALVIAHRLSTIMQADQICVLEKGRITAKGSHQELMEKSPLYRKLVNGQEMGICNANG